MRIAISGLAFATISCSAAPAAPPDPPAAGRAVTTVPDRAHPQPPPCPPEQLSCGLQTPVTSDGIRPFENDEMGLRATFPVGSHVCMSRSGDAPRGFYAWYGTTEAGCPERGDIPAAFMGISASFNALSHKSLRRAAHRCRPLSAAVRRRVHGAQLAIAGHDSLACQADGPGGQLQITVYAMAGTPTDDGAPGVIYFASLGSRTERLEQDLSMFQTFLGEVRIGVR